ncbi:MAG: hypothetical protein JRD89_10880 [Deltaproteobacteria bacterium]|nr:hypothetical protein [Deltaproteobacteria bacterium]
MKNFKYTEPVAIVLLFWCLIMHAMGKDSLIDSIIIALVGSYFGINLAIKKK